MFSLMMMFFTLADTGERENLPLITIPARQCSTTPMPEWVLASITLFYDSDIECTPRCFATTFRSYPICPRKEAHHPPRRWISHRLKSRLEGCRGGNMKKWMTIVFLLGLAVPVYGQEKEEDRVENAGKVMQEILNAPDSIPQSVLDKADCIVVLPSVLKAAFVFGGSYGRGVMTCRGGKEFHGKWGAPTMMALEGGSAGLQIGGQATDFVLLLMNSRSATGVLSSKFKLGGDASVAAGPVGRAASAETDATMRAEILSYSRSRGAFAGISLAGSTLRPDNGANEKLYGKKIDAKQIVLEGAVKAPPSASTLISTLDKASPVNKSKP
jgi:lipid-binding SYLF domain-containing protein